QQQKTTTTTTTTSTTTTNNNNSMLMPRAPAMPRRQAAPPSWLEQKRAAAAEKEAADMDSSFELESCPTDCPSPVANSGNHHNFMQEFGSNSNRSSSKSSSSNNSIQHQHSDKPDKSVSRVHKLRAAVRAAVFQDRDRDLCDPPVMPRF
ncbi:unnamed protein product, partial [Polarella glacialis]